MEYTEIDDAIGRNGLRLVLTAGVPGPWGESAKGILRVKKIPYLPVRQNAGQHDEGLLGWTRQTSAPVAMYQGERPRSGWAEILLLAERLEPQPALLPAEPGERALALGLAHEICGEQGLGWTRRLMLFKDAPVERNSMPWKYGCDDRGSVEGAEARAVEILDLLAGQLHRQHEAGRRFLVGESLSAVDIYWACFSNLLVPLPHAQSPMPEMIRNAYGSWRDAPVDPALIAHRDEVFEAHLGLPQEF
ncbi:MAG: glutathione S-transferase family protein [Myxococcales bacterium]|nr:glutathione S-transferase family protein [Myxococcales bacterium]